MSTTIESEIKAFQQQLETYNDNNLRIVASSSFQTHSIPMLHIIAQLQPSIPIYFLQTGFHFPETITYKNKIAELYGLNVIEIESDIPKKNQRDDKNQFQFVSNPTYCCHINKVVPMDNVMRNKDVWITGVRKDQSATRKQFDKEIDGPHGSVRFHPMLNFTTEMIWDYIEEHKIPHHPLGLKGYTSIGCEPCTAPSFGDDRGGRWTGMNKTECGLHTNLN